METLVQKLADLEESDALQLVQEALDNGTSPLEIFDSCRQGMIAVGKRYEDGEYFVSDLMMAAEIFKGATTILKPAMAGVATESIGTVVVGTVAGDIHDIGKDLVVGMLSAAGFDVHDLGVDVPAATFVEKIRETGATVLALSGLLTIAFDAMRDTVAAVKQADLPQDVKIMIGGGPVTENVRAYTGADAWGESAQAAVSLATKWMEA